MAAPPSLWAGGRAAGAGGARNQVGALRCLGGRQGRVNPIQNFPPPPKKKKPTEQVMNEPTATRPTAARCPATQWNGEEAGAGWMRLSVVAEEEEFNQNRKENHCKPGEGRRNHWKVSSGSIQLLPALPRVGGEGDNTRPPAMRMQPPPPPPRCPPCNTVGEKAHRGQRWGGGGGRREGSCETAIILWVIGNGAYVQVLCRGDGRGGK